jgi:predicted ATPase
MSRPFPDSCNAANCVLFDDLVGAGKQCRRQDEAKRFGRLDVHNQLELGRLLGGSIFALTGKAPDAVQAITSAITSLRSTGATLYQPRHLWHLAMAYAELGQPDDARRCINDAIDKVERSKEKWCEAEVNRIAGEVALKSRTPDTEQAEKYFDRALAVARQQQAKSWELRAAMSMARLWRDQGKPQQARELLAPVYGWFTEGFDTLDLKQAKALLEELGE